MDQILSVREIEQTDVALITNYWLTAEPGFLQAMGVDLNKMLTREQWISMLQQQLEQTYEQKKSYCIIWELNGNPIGHCNVNSIEFGNIAAMHLHIWYAAERKLGLGPAFIKMSLPYFFNHLQLKTICCEPYALNPAPNKALAKAGFTFIKEYSCTPGMINFVQMVSHWEISRESCEL
ncbi:MAG: GNAT family N-acetyltransferase [Chitinophagaceae bacterium]|nr:GNAT family N-acetyltransferase [Chitinophagaceae bacterium]